MKRLSLTGRLIAAVVGAQLLLAIGLVLIGIRYSHRELMSAFDVNLQGRARSVAALVYYPPNNGPGLLFDADEAPASVDPAHPDIYQVSSPARNFEAHTANFGPDVLKKMKARTSWNFKLHGVPYRALMLKNVSIRDAPIEGPGDDTQVTVVYAACTLDIDRRVRAVGLGVAGASLFLLVVTGLLAAWAVRRGLLPLHDLAIQAGAISVRNWSFRPPADAVQAPELAPLVTAMETVLGRLEKSFAQQREFLADAAHELKTSVAILKSTFQSLLQKSRSPQEYRSELQGLMQDVERLEDLLNRMLRLARAEQWAAEGVKRELDKTDLASTCEMALARIQSLARSRGVRVEFATNVNCELPADPADLELVWVNLLENAVHHSPPESTVRMELDQHGDDRVRVSVEDQGSGIGAEDLPYIFERFRRGDASRCRETGGFGLGLAIARAIVEAYGGTIQASSTVGRGTCVFVCLPVSTPTRPAAAPVEAHSAQ